MTITNNALPPQKESVLLMFGRTVARLLPGAAIYAFFSFGLVHILEQEGLASWGWKAATLIGAPILAVFIIAFIFALVGLGLNRKDIRKAGRAAETGQAV